MTRSPRPLAPWRPTPIFVAALIVGALAGPAGATCGGGGGGGLGGAASIDAGGGPAAQIYRVPWKVAGPNQPTPVAADVAWVVYWFPLQAEEARASALQTSRALTMASARCVAMVLVTPDHSALREQFQVPPGESQVVLSAPDGRELTRIPAVAGKLPVGTVEKQVDAELSRREKEAKSLLEQADQNAGTQREQAIADYQRIWLNRCLYPSLGKKAAKALKKLGVLVDQSALDVLGPDDLPDPGALNAADAENALREGLEAELRADYPTAQKLYERAVALDPADTTALRFLGELYRHHTGEWTLASQVFGQIRRQPADAISLAVALHGMGKMTIHAGRFGEGLALFERSLEVYPLPITYRNLAVYWFSEKEKEKAAAYTAKALALAPNDRYNAIFAAVYLAVAGRHDEALAAARANESVLEASYNLAAIWAQVGDTAKAMELLRRHFYEYERYDAVRAMEMQEARDDYMFAAMHQDPAFIELTKMAVRYRDH